MSAVAPVGGASDYGTLQTLLNQSAAVRSELSVAQQQVATGLRDTSYAGLGDTARISLDLRPQVGHEQKYQSNIDAAAGRIGSAQTALTAITAVASDLFAQLGILNGINPSDPPSVAARALAGLEQVANLLNTKVGNVYVFAGDDTGNPPIPNPTAAALVPALLGGTTGAPFSTTIGTTSATVEVGEGERIPIGLIANRNTHVVSTAPTTGSYLRDILTSLARLSTVTNGPTLQADVAAARTPLTNGISSIALEAGALGNAQNLLQSRRDQSVATVISLNSQLSNAEDVDLAATLTRVASLQTALQASYQIIGKFKDLSLANYL